MSAAKKSRNRIYLEGGLSLGLITELSEFHFNYLIRVLRLKDKDVVSVFNELDGEWLAEIQSVSKRSAHIKVCEFLKPAPKRDTTLTLLFAPVKNPNPSFYIQKATELGVDTIIPILTTRTIVRNPNPDKLALVAVEAAEQCERLSIPNIHPSIMLGEIKNLSLGRIFFCDEKEKDTRILDAIAKHKTGNDAILIGPEGGFDEKERELLKSMPNVVPIALGKNILRAETAMIAALAGYYFLL